ncbi:protocatechuate 3,4-dioxygenase [Paraburkholderia caribensis]|uniref:DODA-type extradiol aromatic ring-opening family dioxygenase n=1 Tax=Paraburkholderia caribensis TaxID=75105 RepID=UPI001CB0391B|nr:protocatechuate 3,4-dioxygenase [Paraburkholderia caribensis]CAG9262996.1 Protocatechuate 3,4-dioxygenase [Paraburkholderia caribensis]
MAKVVGGFLLPHEPGIFRKADVDRSPGQTRVMNAYEHIRDRIGELDATTVVIIGSDHYVLFGPTCLPTYLIGIGDLSGPYERFAGIEGGSLPGDPEFATHIAQHGRASGFDWAVAKSLNVDHSIGIPARICALPNTSVRSVVPVYLGSSVEPIISSERAYQLGGSIRDAIDAWSADERVVVIGSGGISHWVGLPEMGKVNETFDRWVIDSAISGSARDLIALRDDEVVAQAGNGALEVRNFLCAMAIVRNRSGSLIAYESGPEWVAGLGFVELDADV